MKQKSSLSLSELMIVRGILFCVDADDVLSKGFRKSLGFTKKELLAIYDKISAQMCDKLNKED